MPEVHEGVISGCDGDLVLRTRALQHLQVDLLAVCDDPEDRVDYHFVLSVHVCPRRTNLGLREDRQELAHTPTRIQRELWDGTLHDLLAHSEA